MRKAQVHLNKLQKETKSCLSMTDTCVLAECNNDEVKHKANEKLQIPLT
jgi:hypothetical protein